MAFFKYLFCLSAVLAASYGSNITPQVFGKTLDIFPAAFGDFNSDALTDIFVISKDQKSVAILLTADQDQGPLLRYDPRLNCTFHNKVTSVVPGDFDGDVFMDVMVTTVASEKKHTDVYILWGGMGSLNCSNATNPIIMMKGQPLALDYNQDMIIDLFGMDTNDERKFWIFNKNRSTPESIPMNSPHGKISHPISVPHSNAFLDLNNDFVPDLMVTTNDLFEIWHGKYSSHGGFSYHHNITIPKNYVHKGQSLYLDLELTGKLDLVLPVCQDDQCRNSSILVHSNNSWHNLPVSFRDVNNVIWGFHPRSSEKYLDAITMRGGDFNMDGYPDLLATLRSPSDKVRTFLLQNVPCTHCSNFDRTFEIKWDALNPFTNDTIMGVFYDFYQDGILDVILIEQHGSDLNVAAFQNSLDYDANFVKVMVLTGLSNSQYPISPGTLGKKKRTYGTNLPGPSISYKTITQDGEYRKAVSAQLPQSAYFSLNLPFTTFGLGRTPNFIDSLTVGVGSESREYSQIIPNSQIVIIPNPPNDPSRWKMQLFVTPSKVIKLSAIALAGTCLLIMLIILGLYWKERREDKIEKNQEAYRFHFDAM